MNNQEKYMPSNFSDTHKLETYKSMIQISGQAYKYLIFINAGAAAGMVAAIDKITRVISQCAIFFAMRCFILGLVLAFSAVMSAWVTQYILHNENLGKVKPKTHIIGLWVTLFFCICSLVFFGLGALSAVRNLD